MNLHGSPIIAGDYIHDLVDGRLRVVDVESAVFAVRMPNGQFRKYDHNGKAATRPRPTAFWFDPVIVNPLKDARAWDQQKRYIESAAAILQAQATLVGDIA